MNEIHDNCKRSHHIRRELIADILKKAEIIRRNLSPDILAHAKGALGNQQKEDSYIKIDRQKNIRFVKDFLNSPSGAHLKDKIDH